MSQELYYTSAPRGLWPGSHAITGVACTSPDACEPWSRAVWKA